MRLLRLTAPVCIFRARNRCFPSGAPSDGAGRSDTGLYRRLCSRRSWRVCSFFPWICAASSSVMNRLVFTA